MLHVTQCDFASNFDISSLASTLSLLDITCLYLSDSTYLIYTSNVLGFCFYRFPLNFKCILFLPFYSLTNGSYVSYVFNLDLYD